MRSNDLKHTILTRDRGLYMGKVSIIVPVYNNAKFLPQCIESLLNQTYNNIEIILINDGSTDSSLKVCKKYEKRDERIKLFSIENSGVSTARNLGIDHSTGKYITFVDSDDWVEKEMVEFAVKKIKETKSDIVIWSFFRNYPEKELEMSMIPGVEKKFSEDKDKEILYLKSIYARILEKRNTEDVSAGTVMCKLYEKDLILNNKIRFNPELIRAEDVVFNLNAFSSAKKICFFNKSLYHYRVNKSSITFNARYIQDTKKPFNLLLEEFESFINTKIKGEKDNYYRALYARTIQVIKWHLEHNYFHDDYTKGLWGRRKEIMNLINSRPFKVALSNVDLSLLPKKEKMITILFRLKLVLTCYCIYILYEKKKRK